MKCISTFLQIKIENSDVRFHSPNTELVIPSCFELRGGYFILEKC